MSTSVKAGRIIPVENKNRHFAAKREYQSIWVEDVDGSNERCLLFTKKELEKAEYRASRNKEDIPKKGFFSNILD